MRNSFVKKDLEKYYNTLFVFYVDLFMTKIASIFFMGDSVFFGAKFDQNAQNINSGEYFVAIFCFLERKKTSKFENKLKINQHM